MRLLFHGHYISENKWICLHVDRLVVWRGKCSHCTNLWLWCFRSIVPVRLLLSAPQSRTGDSFSVLGMRRLEPVWADEPRVSRDDTAKLLEELTRGVLWPRGELWLCRGVKPGIPASQPAPCCRCDEAPPTCVLLLLDCWTTDRWTTYYTGTYYYTIS